MTRTLIQLLNFVLLAAVMLSGFLLIRTQYDSRTTITKLQQAQKQERDLASARRTLEVRKSEATSNSHIERIAKSKLGMAVSPANEVRYVRIPSLDIQGVAP